MHEIPVTRENNASSSWLHSRDDHTNNNFATPYLPSSSSTSHRIPHRPDFRQASEPSPVHSLHNSFDDFHDHADADADADPTAAYLSWSSSLAGSSATVTPSPHELRPNPIHFQHVQPAGPFMQPIGAEAMFEHDLSHFGPSYQQLELNSSMHLSPYVDQLNPSLFVDPSIIHGWTSPTMTIPHSAHNVSFDPSYAYTSAVHLQAPTMEHQVSNTSRSLSPAHAFQVPSHLSHVASPNSCRRSGTAQSPSCRGSSEGVDDVRSKNRCPYPDCGRIFKDLKAHMLTHQDERPEKCPIPSCEFHKRGFARRYDRNRHLVTTHYKSTIVCGFCPGSGSSSEKSFNRTDVFKRHLVALHGVENTPPNGRKRSPSRSARHSPTLPDGTTGKCSTCNVLFNNPQDLFEHLDDCVLRVVQQVDPAEANNERALLSVAEDNNVKSTIKSHGLKDADTDSSDDADDDDDVEDDVARSSKGTSRAVQSLPLRTQGNRDDRVLKHTLPPRTGLTFSRGGIPSNQPRVSTRRAPRREYPRSWGSTPDTMKLRKRVLCVFDGPRRMCKDDMMMGSDHEVRVPLDQQGEQWVTDLDVQTLARADAFHGATEEERGPWDGSNGSSDLNLADLNFDPPRFT